MRKLMSLLLGIGWGLASASQTALGDGACCLGDGTCLDTNQAGCDGSSGEFLGEGTTCIRNICVGACCLADKACAEDASDGCNAAAGSFQGAQTTCTLHCAAKLSSVFSYQGQPKQAGVPLQGTADLEFSLWTSAKGADLVGNLLAVEKVPVSGGLFSVPLDIGSNVFNGNVKFNYFVNGVRRGFADLELIRENHGYVPEVRGVPFGTQYRLAHRQILVENGILNPDFTPNEATAAMMGWTLRDPEPDELSRAASSTNGESE